MGKTNPLNEKDLENFIELQRNFKNSDRSWTIDISTIDSETWNLSVKNPIEIQPINHRSPAEVIAEIEALASEEQVILERIKALS